MDERIAKQFTINEASPVPLYLQLKTQLVELLKQGTFQVGDRLPAEAEFCELLDTSRPTVRQVFSELISEGYTTRHKVEGTSVSRPKIEGYFLQKLESFDEEVRSLHLTSSTRVIVNEAIKLLEEYVEIYSKSKQILHLQCLRCANHEEMVLVNTFVPYEHFLDIELEDSEQFSLCDTFSQKYQTEVAYVGRTVEARETGQRERMILNMEEDDVPMHVETVTYTQQDEPVEYSIVEYRGDRDKSKMRLIRREN